MSIPNFVANHEALHRGSSHCVLLGDPAQLPATIFEVSGRKTKYDRSLFQRYVDAWTFGSTDRRFRAKVDSTNI